MAGVQQGEKQLFEKFWRGTFKAVATPRPESIIVASITAPSLWSLMPLCPLRSPSYSPSPVKKKKKKSSKKRKRNRYFFLENVIPCCSHVAERTHTQSPSTDLPRAGVELGKGTTAILRNNILAVPVSWRHRARSREEGRKTRRRHSWHHSKITAKRSSSAEVQASQKASQTLPLYSFLSSKEVISQSGSSADLFTKTDSPPGNLASQNGEYHEYDSGNDTSSPPSTQTSSSRSKDSQEKRSLPKLANSDNSSDSGNSFTSCFSQTKGTALENLSPDAQGQDRRSVIASSCCSWLRPWRMGQLFPLMIWRSLVQPRPPVSLILFWFFPISRSSSRSPSYSSKSCKKSPGSRSSRPRRSPSYSRYSRSRDREREHKYSSSEKESQRQRRRRSYSPLRKRRRDSPSHLEARRITSARKRPIPYYRPSPSSSSSAGSYSSWYSSFSRSPSRSRSYSSYRTSRSRSWSSSRSSGPRSSRSRSRSRSYDSGASSDSLRR
uniref:Serine/arginine repetitive matrix 4 n=1 Tax=Catharus ustulatus TaxID=91951 RepID=A0A8C3VKV1_CATUS